MDHGPSPFCVSVSSGPTLQMRRPREAKASGQDCTLDVLLSQIQAPGGVWALSAAGWNDMTEASLDLESFVGGPVGAGGLGTGVGGRSKPKAERQAAGPGERVAMRES